MKDLAIFCLTTIGLCQIIMYGKIFDAIRPKWQMLKCALCTGFWIGATVFAMMSYAGFKLCDDFIVGLFLFGWLSSAINYAYDAVIGDFGLKIDKGNQKR